MSAKKQITMTRILKAFVITVISMMVLVVGAGYLYVNQVGGLSRFLENELSTMVGSGTATVGDARISVSLSSQPIQLTASDLMITLDSEQINLPRVDMGFGWTSVLGGRPETILFRGVKLDLVKKGSGWSGSPAILFLDRLATNANQTGLNSAHSQNVGDYLGGIKLITIETDRLSLSHENRALPDLIFENIYIDVSSADGGEVSGSMRASRLDEARKADGSFTLSFNGWPGSKTLKIDLSASELQTTGISGYIDGLPSSLNQIGVLSGHVAVEMENSILTSVSADVTLADGILDVPGIRRNAFFRNADLIFAYDMARDNLTVNKAELQMIDNRQLSFIGTVDQFHAPSSIVIGKIEAKNLPVQALLDDWPDAVASHLYSAIKKRFNGGHFKMVKVGFEGVFQSQTSALKLLKLDLESQFSAVRMNLSNGQYQRLVATIDGDLGMSVGSDGIQQVLVDLDIKDGSMLVAGYDRIDVPSGQMKSVMRDGKVELEHLALNFGGAGRFDLKGVVKMNDVWAVRDLKLRLNVPDMDAPLFSALWPKWAAPKPGTG